MRDWLFAALLFLSGVLVVVGVSVWSLAAALVVAGVLLAVWAWLVFVVGEAAAPQPVEVEEVDG